MKSKLDEKVQSLLVLLKLDARRLFERIKYREAEYLSIFSIKRSREHFKEIFRSRYDDVDMQTLATVSQDIIISLDQFYSGVEEMRWYLGTTEDMPNTVQDKVESYIASIEPHFNTLNLYINAELGIKEEVLPEPIEDNIVELDESDEFFQKDDAEQGDYSDPAANS